MTKPKDGGSAFPREQKLIVHDDGTERFTAVERGMTLRDYFAAAALQGMLTNRDYYSDIERFTKEAYEAADAMLKQREAIRKEP